MQQLIRKLRQPGPGHGETGFTLIELMVVLTILTIIVGLVVPNVFGIAKGAECTMIVGQHEKMREAVFMYYIDTSEYPTEWSGNNDASDTEDHELWSDDCSGWDGPYLDRPILQKNSWGGNWGVVEDHTLSGMGVFVCLVYEGVPDELAQCVDDKMDDGAASSGIVQWDNGSSGNRTLYIGITKQGDTASPPPAESEPPSVATNSATNVGNTVATLNGELTDMGTADNVEVSFEWGTDTSYGNETTAQTRSETGDFSTSLTGLQPDTTYHFRAKATGDGTDYGNDETFTTPAEGEEITYTVEHNPKNTSGCIKFEDAEPEGLGEDGANETDTFVIEVNNAGTSVNVTTKAGSQNSGKGQGKGQGQGGSASSYLQGVGDFTTDDLGFTITLVEIDGNTYTLTVESVSNNHALSHVKFCFGDGADVQSPEETEEDDESTLYTTTRY
ncbi:MAG: prepilin-type N-terminal cleavage/methylation domain-containing protein [Chloroflexota bacterium]